jgi:hypothetical protein
LNGEVVATIASNLPGRRIKAVFRQKSNTAGPTFPPSHSPELGASKLKQNWRETAWSAAVSKSQQPGERLSLSARLLANEQQLALVI